MADRLQVRLLGPLEVTVGDTAIGPEGAFRRSLFALLALHANEVVGMGALVDGLWGDSPPRSATGVVQTYVSTWRKSFGPVRAVSANRIVTVGTGYRLRLDDEESDLLLFLRLADRGRRLAADGRPVDGRATLERALALRRGPVLAGLSELPFHASAVAPIEDRLDRTVEDWADVLLRTGSNEDLSAVVAALQRLREAQPWRERSTELLMWGLFRQGRQRDALESYEETRRRLADELGVDPGPALRDMHTRVLRQEEALTAGASGRRVRRAPRLDSFIGRADDVDAVCDLLGASRLVTLTGPGGSGKTRLAEEAAADMEARAGVETAVVELAGLDDAALVPGAIAARLGLQPAETLHALVARLADRALLLVLDNLEQIPGVGGTVGALLRGTTALRVLATSREPLRVAGEQQYAVQPLPVPPADEGDARRLAAIPSVVLLVDRAHAVDPTAAVTEADAAALRDIVRAVDGLPLAIEVAAPWLAPLTPAGLLAELRHPLDLHGRRTDAEERHRTLRTMIAWSYDRLSTAEQRLLTRLSVLRGSGDLDAVRAIGGEDLEAPAIDVLMDLLDRHLVQPAEPVAGAPRFRLLETVRQFAAECLATSGEQPATELRAAEWFARWAVGLAAHGDGPDADAWLSRTVAEAENLRAAMGLFDRTGRTEEQLQLVVDAMPLWFSVGYELEGERRLEHALAVAAPDASARAVALVYLSYFVGARDHDREMELVEQAATLAHAEGDEPVLALALNARAEHAPDAPAMRRDSARAAALANGFRGAPVRYGTAAPDALVAEAAANTSAYGMFRDLRESLRWQERAVAAAERSGDRRQVARQVAMLARQHLFAGDGDEAREIADRARSLIGTSVNGRWEDNVALVNALVLLHRGEYAAAEIALRELISSGLAAGRLLYVQYGSYYLVDLLFHRGELAEVDAVLTQAEGLLGDSADLRWLTPLRARRARLLRMTGRADEAAAMLKESEKGIDPTELRFEHMIWLAEQALTAGSPADRRAWIERLDALSERTGVQVPPWERRWLEPDAVR